MTNETNCLCAVDSDGTLIQRVNSCTDEHVRVAPPSPRDARAEALDALWAWCDERRNAPTVTTLGMVQAKIKELQEGR